MNEALRIPFALAEQYGKAPARPVDVAVALEILPTTGHFKTLTGAALAYGLTEGGAQAEDIALTDLGRRIVAPTEEGDDLVAKREALLRPRVIHEFLQKYDGSQLPSDQIGKNVLETMGVPRQATERTLKLIVSGAESLGLLHEISGKRVVNLKGARPPAAEEPAVEGREDAYEAEDDADETPSEQPPVGTIDESERPSAIFLGHGKNRKPLEQLTKLLDEYKIPYKVAVDEPNRGRPISQKVAETMGECGAAILIFTADQEFHDSNGNVVWRPSENVVYELGAASMLYGGRIILFKEEGVDFPTNFRDIGHIPFAKDDLGSKVNELFRELISFGLIRVTVG